MFCIVHLCLSCVKHEVVYLIIGTVRCNKYFVTQLYRLHFFFPILRHSFFEEAYVIYLKKKIHLPMLQNSNPQYWVVGAGLYS